MLDKCANPVCRTSFRKLGSGKLFAFESVTSAKAADTRSGTNRLKEARSPVFYWLCEKCSLTFTLALDAERQLTLHEFPVECDSRISIATRSIKSASSRMHSGKPKRLFTGTAIASGE